jgi:hypothetical protein
MLHTIRDGLLGKRSVKTIARRASAPLRKSRLELETLETRKVPSVTYVFGSGGASDPGAQEQFALQNGNLAAKNSSQPTAVVLDQNIRSFALNAADPLDAVYALTDSNVLEGITVNSGNPVLPPATLDMDVQSFMLGSDAKYLSYLKSDHTLWSLATGSTVPVEIASNVESYTVGSDAKYLFYLKSDHTLWAENNGTSAEVDGNVQSFLVGSDAKYLFYLKNDATLWLENNGSSSQVDSNVQSYTVGSDAKYLFYLKNDATLWLETSGTVAKVDSNVQSFTVGSDAQYLFYLKTDHTLWFEHNGTTPEVDIQIQYFGITPDAIDLFYEKQDMTFYQESYGHFSPFSPPANLVGVTAFATGPDGTTLYALNAGGFYDAKPLAASGLAFLDSGTTLVPGGWSYTYYAGGTATGLPLPGAPTNAGTCTVVASFASSDPNFHNASGGLQSTFVISPALPAITITAPGGTFTGSPFVAQGLVVGVGGAAPPTGSLAYTYYSGSGATGTPLASAPTAPGTYTVVASFTSADPNYGNASAQTTFMIARAPTPKPVLTANVLRVRGRFLVSVLDNGVLLKQTRLSRGAQRRPQVLYQDVNGDGVLDLVIQFRKGRKTIRLIYSGVDASPL